MSGETKVSQGPERLSKAMTRPVTIPLDEFILQPERFCHRDAEELTEPKLKPLMDSIVVEGLQTPPEFYRDPQQRPVVETGHRRINAMRFLAKRNTPGFTPNMPVAALEVLGATEHDLLCRSVSDNANRNPFSQHERIRAAKTLHDAGVSVERAAYTFGVSTKTYERDLLIAKNPWMFELVEKHAIVPTTASALLEVASKENRLHELEIDLKSWVTDTREKIEQKKKARQAQGLSELRPTEQVVKTHMTKRLVAQWVRDLKAGQRFARAVPWDFGAAIDSEANRLQIDGVKLDLTREPLENLAKVAAKLSRLSQTLLEFLKRRHALETHEGPQRFLGAQIDPDLEFLRQAGLADLAADLEARSLDSDGDELEASTENTSGAPENK